MSVGTPPAPAGAGEGGAAPGPRRPRLRRWLAPAALVTAALAAWEGASRAGILDPLFAPPPSDVAAALVEDRGLLVEGLAVTGLEVVVGLGLAIALGLGSAVALHLSSGLHDALMPIVIASQTIPPVVFAPVLVLWLGYGIAAKVAVVVLVCFFPVCVATLRGLRATDPDLIGMMRTLDASRSRILLAVEAPSALPVAFAGIRVAAAVSVVGAVIGEWVGAERGLGRTVLEAQNQLLVERMLAAVVILSVMAVALVAAVAALERRIVRWQPGTE